MANQPSRAADIAALLGGKKTLGGTPSTTLEFAERVRRGLPPAAVFALREALDINDAEFAPLLGVSARTVARMREGLPDRVKIEVIRPMGRGEKINVVVYSRKKTQTTMLGGQLVKKDPVAAEKARAIAAEVSDRTYRLANLFAQAKEFLGPVGARQWLKTPQRGLGGRVPLDLAVTEAGAREVESLLGRIAHGVYA